MRGEIIRALHRRLPSLDLIRVQDTLPVGTVDSEVIAWAAAENRVLITNDRNTMVGLAYRLVVVGQPMPGLIATTLEQSVGSAVNDILLIAELMPPEEIRDQVVVYLPL